MRKKIIYLICLLLINLNTIAITSCSVSSYSKSEDPKTNEQSIPYSINADDIAVIKEFAENYEPKSTNKEVIPSPPLPNDRIFQAVSNLANAQSRKHEKYVILIFLRLYRFHIEHFKQSYELGRENPLTKEFFRIIKSIDYQKAEIMPSYLAHNFVKDSPDFLNYDLIVKEMKRIEKAENKRDK